jgi:phosphotriesterase-related protein
LTHCEDGTGAVAQVHLLATHGADLRHVALSHVDKVVDHAYHRDLLATGAYLEYDQGFRWKDGPNGTLQLLEWAVADGFGDRILLGLDAARQGYWATYDGAPGWTFLLGPFAEEMRRRGMGDAELRGFFVTAPAAVYAFARA